MKQITPCTFPIDGFRRKQKASPDTDAEKNRKEDKERVLFFFRRAAALNVGSLFHNNILRTMVEMLSIQSTSIINTQMISPASG